MLPCLFKQSTENLSTALVIWICFYKFFNERKEFICGKTEEDAEFLISFLYTTAISSLISNPGVDSLK